MANQLLTRNEMVLELGIPYLRAAILAAQSALKPNETMVTVPNLVRDCVPLAIDRSALENGGAAEMLAKLDEIERTVRARMAAA